MDILVADDHQLFLDGFSLLLKKLDENVNILSCDNGESVITLLEKKKNFDLIILDIGMPDIDGLTLFNMIRKSGVFAPIVFVSATENIRTISRALQLGASGIIPKQCNSRILIDGLRKILNGGIYIYEDFEPYIAHNLELAADEKNKQIKLTKRQLDVLRLMSNGSSNKEIARLLFISETTVKSHISVVFQTLNASNRVDCIRKAENLGLIDVTA